MKCLKYSSGSMQLYPCHKSNFKIEVKPAVFRKFCVKFTIKCFVLNFVIWGDRHVSERPVEHTLAGCLTWVNEGVSKARNALPIHRFGYRPSSFAFAKVTDNWLRSTPDNIKLPLIKLVELSAYMTRRKKYNLLVFKPWRVSGFIHTSFCSKF